MKLENLKTDKFKPFMENEIKTAIAIIGGEPKNTTYSNIKYTGNDVIDVDTYPALTNLAQPTSTLVDGRPGTVDYKQTSWNPR